MDDKIVPFKEFLIPDTIADRIDDFSKAQEYAEKNAKQKFNELLKNSLYSFVIEVMGFTAIIGGFILAIAGSYYKDFTRICLIPMSGYALMCVSVDQLLKRKIFGKKIMAQISKKEIETKLELDNPLNQHAVALIEEITNFNPQLVEFNQFLKRVDDFRPLREEEVAKYNSLNEQRRTIGIKILELEDKVNEQDAIIAAGTEPKALPPEQINRADLEAKMEEKHKMIEAATKEYEQLKQEHAALCPRLMC